MFQPKISNSLHHPTGHGNRDNKDFLRAMNEAENGRRTSPHHLEGANLNRRRCLFVPWFFSIVDFVIFALCFPGAPESQTGTGGKKQQLCSCRCFAFHACRGTNHKFVAMDWSVRNFLIYSIGNGAIKLRLRLEMRTVSTPSFSDWRVSPYQIFMGKNWLLCNRIFDQYSFVLLLPLISKKCVFFLLSFFGPPRHEYDHGPLRAPEI